MEAETEVKVIQVHLKCPDCDTIMNRYERERYWSSTFTYKCSHCDTTVNINKTYPYIKYVPK